MFVDAWIQKVQRWLNREYGGIGGYATIAEDGSTGWKTVFALRHALQHELGITQLSDNFGNQTMTRLAERLGEVTARSPSRIIAIVQCGLWCKGYWGDDPFGTWSDRLAASVAKLRTDMGLANSPVVSPKVFKSLLSMDAYSLRDGGTSKIQEIQRWLNRRYTSRADYDLVPCDGVYSRDVQHGLMLGVQFEIGMFDGAANGNFGPGTRQGLRDRGILRVNDTDDEQKMVSLYQAALIFNGFTAPKFSGKFDKSTMTETRSFQSFCALSATGAADFATWASLLVSTGDSSRSAAACDTNMRLTSVTAAQLRAAGYQNIGRYINGNEKRLGFNEPEIISRAGLKWFPIYQESNDAPEEFSAERGDIQGQRLVMRMRQLGIASGARVYLAVDFDATGEDIPALIIPHFKAVKAAMDRSKSVKYRLGVYGTRNVCRQLAEHSLSDSSFVSDMSAGYSGNLGFTLPTNWAYDQIANLDAGANGVSIEIDKDVASTRAEGLTLADVVRTPRRYSGGTAIGYDESFYWRLAALVYRAEACADGTGLSQRMINEIVLTGLQKPTYWGTGAWSSFTPALENVYSTNMNLSLTLGAVSQSFESSLGSELYARPSGGLVGDVAHWAASTRGFLVWGSPGPRDSYVQAGDLGAWALDLVTAWNEYERARRDSRGDLPLADWMASRIGADSAFFGEADMRADMAAFLVSKRMREQEQAPLDQIVRELLLSCEVNPGQLASGFFIERFGSVECLRAAVASLFAEVPSGIVAASRGIFLDVRLPGTSPENQPVPTSGVATEIADITRGFHEALLRASRWKLQ